MRYLPDSRERAPAHVQNVRNTVAAGLLIVVVGALPCAGQSLRLGTTWAAPDDMQEARQDLIAIREAGFVAVRSRPLPAADLYSVADSLDLSLYIDLPVRAMPAGDLADTLSFARTQLTDILFLAQRYPSIRAVGLADIVDTSVPVACSYFRDLLAPPRTEGTLRPAFYYTTRFVEGDRCGETVDFVLFDLLDADISRIESVTEWAATSEMRTGVGAVGTWTDLDLQNRGLRNVRSPESQARYLEKVLRSLTASGDLEVVFVHRWRDPISTDDAFADLIQRRYGLHNSSGGPRPALEVASGFASGRQVVFAFDVGLERPSPWIWMIILGWVILAGLGLTYATSPRMRHMVPRYYMSHGFFREAVVSGRESLVGETIAILFAVSLGCGMLLTVLLSEISFLPVFTVGRSWMTPEVRDFIGAILDQRWTLMVMLASAYALVAVVWTSVLSFLSRKRQTLLPAQVMMLVVWPQWTLLVLLLVAPAIAVSPPAARLEVSALALVGVFVLLCLSLWRTVYDYWQCSRVAVGLLLLGVALHPVLLLTAYGLFLITRHEDAADYLRHLATIR